MEPRELAARLAGWENGDGPLYRRLATCIADRIRTGELPPGLRLPAERRLAEVLKVGRGTVVAAYRVLREQDLVRSRQGSGTVVAGTSPTGRDSPLSLEALLGLHVARPGAQHSDVVDLSAAAWPDASHLPTDVFDTTDPRFAELLSGPGYHSAGIPALRRAVADYYTSRNLETTPEQILVTCGAHQAIPLLMRLAVAPGDVVVTEELTYPGAADSLRASGGRGRTVGVGPRGAKVEDLEPILDEDDPRIVYLIPSVHNPTGTVMPNAARKRVLELVRKRNTIVVDDESLVETTFDGAAPAPLASFARDPETVSRIFTVGSASKSFWGGLRVGWVRGPEPAIQMLTRLKMLADLASPVLSQLVCVRLLERRTEVAESRRVALNERADALMDALGSRLPEWRVDRPAGGLCLWVALPDGGARRFAMHAARHGVAVVPGPTCSPAGEFDDHLRLSLGPQPGKLREGVERLEQAWRSYRGTARATAKLEVVV